MNKVLVMRDESLVTSHSTLESQRDYFSNLVLLNSDNKTLSKNNKRHSTSVRLTRPIPSSPTPHQSYPPCTTTPTSAQHGPREAQATPTPHPPSSTCHDVCEQWPT